MIRLLSIICLALVCSFPAIGASWPSDTIQSLFTGRLLAPVEGIWQFPDDGAILLVKASSQSTYDIIILDSPDLSVLPGTPMGTLTATPTRNVYDAHIEKKGKGALHTKFATFTVTAEGTLRVEPYSKGKKISVRRLLYQFLKVSLVDNNTRPHGLDGAVRVYPRQFTKYLPVCL